MNQSLSLIPGADITVDDFPALRLSPEGIRALPVLTGPRLAVVGRIGPKCRDCRDFESVVTHTGIVTCDNPVHAETKPQLPMRPTPHERDGRQDSPEPARPHRRAALLVG
ncbi:hypothetical protein [Streptomyces sp. NBC_00239]|uniref:hypothetical protein n=1 Tax=Streptomyces sp. NBC_00239 TaxID=2903640 RepID=UPI002E27C9EC|nr:hypothetical protein [Streptomyces sp. NBC_00239]